MAKTILITGAEGFVGQHAVQQALAEGHRVVALVHDKADKPARKHERLMRMAGSERLTIAQGDITSEASMRRVFAQHPGVDAVIHSAALMIVPNNDEGKASAKRINAQGTRNVAVAANEAGRNAKKIVMFHYISSAHVLNQLGGEAAASFDPKKSLNAYGSSKLAGEQALAGLSHLFTITTYPPHMYGPDQEKSLLIPTLVRKGLRGQPLPIAGDGSTPMQYLHVDNFVSDLLSTLDVTPDKPGHMRYAIPGDTATTVGGVAQTVCDALDGVVKDSSIRSFRERIAPSGGTSAAGPHVVHGLPQLRGKRNAPSMKETMEAQVYHLLPGSIPLL